jgi:hypothetical protein
LEAQANEPEEDYEEEESKAPQPNNNDEIFGDVESDGSF